MTVPSHPSLNLAAVCTQLVQRNQDKIAPAYLLQIRKLLHKYIGQAVVRQDHIPVVADRDGRRYHPGMVDVLFLHPVQSRGDAGQRFAAALFPLKQPVPLLQHQVQIVPLDIIEADFLFVFRIPQMKVCQPCADLRVFLHSGKGSVLFDIFPLFSSHQAFIAGKFPRAVGRNNLVHRDRRPFFLRNLPARLAAVALINKIIVPFHQGNFILGRLGILLLKGAFQIGKYLCLRQPLLCPLLVLHIFRLRLRAEPVKILVALGIAFLQLRMALDLIEHLLHLV